MLEESYDEQKCRSQLCDPPPWLLFFANFSSDLVQKKTLFQSWRCIKCEKLKAQQTIWLGRNVQNINFLNRRLKKIKSKAKKNITTKDNINSHGKPLK